MMLKKLMMMVAVIVLLGCPAPPPATPVAGSDQAPIATGTPISGGQLVTRIIYVEGMT